MNEIAHTIKSLMKENKLTMQGLADRSGVPFSSIKSIIQGRSKSPRGNTLKALAQVFDCEISELITGEALSTKEATPGTPEYPSETKIELFKQAIIIFDETATKNHLIFENKQDLRDNCINQLFEFALEKAESTKLPPEIDRSFAQWLVTNSLG